MPNALPRSFGMVKVVASSDSAAGASIAAKTPWQARAVTSMAKLTEAPPMAEATAKPARPVMNITRRPTKSARRPPKSSRLPNDSEYAVTIHCRSTSLKCSAVCAEGSAMFMTVESRTTMSWAIAMTTRISQRRGSGSDDAPDQASCAPPLCPPAWGAPAPWPRWPPGAGTLASDIPTTNLEYDLPFMS
jgi:hypothetical protein